jgi:NTE family protein
MDEYRTALVLQGGGALGAYEYGVIRALYESRKKFRPTVVTGTSIGAINAAILVGAKRDPIDTLGRVWSDRFTAMAPLPPLVRQFCEQVLPSGAQKLFYPFGAYGLYEMRPENWIDPGAASSLYSTRRLRSVLESTIDLGMLHQSPTRLVVSAVNIGTGEYTEFDNRRGLSFDQIIASGSLPPLFPMVQIGGSHYWDGGLFSNTPLSTAINCLEQCEPDNPNVRRELIVVELFPMRAEVPDSLNDVINRLGQLLFTSKLELDQKLFRKTNNLIELLHEIEKEIPVNSAIRDHPGYKKLASHKKIDAFKVITARLPEDKLDAFDYSKGTIEFRITAGFEDAIEQRISEYTSV